MDGHRTGDSRLAGSAQGVGSKRATRPTRLTPGADRVATEALSNRSLTRNQTARQPLSSKVVAHLLFRGDVPDEKSTTGGS